MGVDLQSFFLRETFYHVALARFYLAVGREKPVGVWNWKGDNWTSWNGWGWDSSCNVVPGLDGAVRAKACGIP